MRRLTPNAEETLSQQPDGGSRAVRALRAAWATELTERQKYYILLYYHDKRTMEDIAAFCGVNVGTVSRTLARGRNRLRKVLRFYSV